MYIKLKTAGLETDFEGTSDFRGNLIHGEGIAGVRKARNLGLIRIQSYILNSK